MEISHLFDTAITSFITFLVIFNPPGTAVVFATMTADMPKPMRQNSARTACLMAGIILLLFAGVGRFLLSTLGISIPAFHIAGGLLLFMLATKMVFGHQSGGHGVSAQEDADQDDITVFPLAFPIIAGPGAMTSVILLTGRANGSLAQSLVIVATLMAALAIVFVLLLQAGTVVRLLGKTGSNVVARVMGIILAALAVEFIVDGTHDVFILWHLIQ